MKKSDLADDPYKSFLRTIGFNPNTRGCSYKVHLHEVRRSKRARTGGVCVCDGRCLLQNCTLEQSTRIPGPIII